MPLGSHSFFGGCTPVRPVLAFLHMYIQLQSQCLSATLNLYVAAGTPALKLLVGHLGEHQKLTVLVPL